MIKYSHCGRGNHKAIEYYLKNATCRKRDRKGHIERVCHSKAHDTGSQVQSTREKSFQTNAISDSTNTLEYSENSEEYTLFTIQNVRDSTKPLIVTMTLNDEKVPMKIDTGSAVTILPEATYKAISTDPFQYTTLKLCTYSGEKLEVKVSALCKVEFNGKTYELPVVVLVGNGPILLGHSWLYHISLRWTELFYKVLNITDPLSYLLHKHQQVFSDKIGTYASGKMSIFIDSSVALNYCKPRPLPFAIKEKVEAELKKTARPRCDRTSKIL